MAGKCIVEHVPGRRLMHLRRNQGLRDHLFVTAVRRGR